MKPPEQNPDKNFISSSTNTSAARPYAEHTSAMWAGTVPLVSRSSSKFSLPLSPAVMNFTPCASGFRPSLQASQLDEQTITEQVCHHTALRLLPLPPRSSNPARAYIHHPPTVSTRAYCTSSARYPRDTLETSVFSLVLTSIPRLLLKRSS